MNEKEWKWVEMNERWISMEDWMSKNELRWEKKSESGGESERWWIGVIDSVRRW